MLIYKSFFRKRTTRIYLIIYTLIILIICLLLSVRTILEKKQQELYYGSNILISVNDIEKIENIKNIDKIYKAINVTIEDYNEMIMIYDEKYKLDNHHIVIPNIYKEQFKINDTINIYINNNRIELVIKDYDDIIGNSDIVYVSEYIIEAYTNTQDSLYLITLKDWEKEDNVIKELNKIDNITDINIRINNSSNSYTTFIKILNVMLIVIMILFVVVLLITSFNIIEDEKKKNLVYYKIGYRKNKLKVYNFVKICLLIVLASSASTFIMIILKLIYKVLL